MLRTGFIGAGNMAFALAGAISESFADAVIVPFDISQERISLFKDSFSSVEPADSVESLSGSCDAVFLSVKPQMMSDVIKPLEKSRGLFITIAAGLKLDFYEKAMPEARIVRVMPNTPCLVGEMAAGYTAGKLVTAEDLDLVRKLLSAAGTAVEVREELIDTVTGVSGSGPAYFARIAEAFIEAGVAGGLSPEMSTELAIQTMKGTAALLQQKKMTPEELVKMVSSPNGTTVAGREILESSDYKEVIAATVARTIERSMELGK